MNTTDTMGTPQGHRPPDWLSKVERYINRAADALVEGGESIAKDVEQRWRSRKQRTSREQR